jgi:hypothetical protein
VLTGLGFPLLAQPRITPVRAHGASAPWICACDRIVAAAWGRVSAAPDALSLNLARRHVGPGRTEDPLPRESLQVR